MPLQIAFWVTMLFVLLCGGWSAVTTTDRKVLMLPGAIFLAVVFLGCAVFGGPITR